MASILNVILRVTGQSSLGGTFTGLNQGLQLADAAVSALNDTVGQFIRQGVQFNAFLESSELQFKTLTGSASVAHDQVQMLFNLAARTPFTFESVTKASRQLEVFGGAALDTRDNLTLLGDAAAATGADITEVTFWTGRLYSELQAGKPIGESARWLQQMGVMSAEARTRLESLQESGASGNQIWAAYVNSLQRFGGAMEEQAVTWAGLTSTMQDQFTLLEGVATKDLFGNLEGQVKRLNAVLSDPQTQHAAEVFGQGLGLLATEAENTATVFYNTNIAPAIVIYNDAADALQRLKDARDAVFGAPDQPPPTTTSGAVEAGIAAQRQYQQATDDVAAAQSNTNRVLGAAAAAGDGATRSADALAAAHAALRDETLRANEASRLFAEGLHNENSALSASQQALASAQQARHSYNIDAITAAQNVKASDQREANAKQAAENEKAAFQEAADAIRQKNQQTADAIREAQQVSQEAVRRAYGETADEAERAFDRVRAAAAPPVDTLSQQLNEAINRQVREGIAGTADAEKQLDDIRRAHLATLPDLVALDQQYAAAQGQVHDADVAVALAQRNLAVAMAASNGQQTLQTAALQHGVTAAQDADQAARDHAASLGAERSQAISDTNALKDVASANKDAASATQDAVKGFQDLGGGFDAMASGAGAASIAMDGLKAATRGYQTELDRMQETMDRMNMIGQQQGIASQMNDLDTSEQTLGLRQQLLPLEQQMDLLKLAREATTHKERQKQLDEDIADTQLKIDSIQTQIGVKQRAGQARALDMERLTIPYQRQRLWMENDILDVKEQQLDVQMAINAAQRMTQSPTGIVTPPLLRLTSRGWEATPQTNNITIVNHGPVGVDDLGRQITDTVNNGLRNGAVRVPGLATR